MATTAATVVQTPVPAGCAPGVCRACGAQLVRAASLFGRDMHLDREPAGDGNVRVGPGGVAAMLPAGDERAARAAGEPLYRSHTLSCPHGARGGA